MKGFTCNLRWPDSSWPGDADGDRRITSAILIRRADPLPLYVRCINTENGTKALWKGYKHCY